MTQVVTPWDVKGNIDYDKLIREFGVQKLDKALIERIEKKAGESHHFLQRNIFFAHRDLKKVLDEAEKGKPFYLYTGRAPSGPVHIGHTSVWYFTKWLQDTYDVDVYFQFPDEEKYLMKKKLSWEESQQYLNDNLLDVIAVGFNPKKTHFIVDTKHADLLYKLGIKVSKHVTFSTIKSAFGFDNSANIGAIFYTAMQATPAMIGQELHGRPMNCLIPHAIDQDPHFRITRDVLPKLGYAKPASIQCRFLPGLAGMETDGKMSSSATNTAILTTDDPKTVKKKINKYAFSGGKDTVEEHRKLGGNPDIDVSYQWLTFFEPDDEKLKQIYTDYKSGKLLSGELKAILIETLNTFLAEHQKRRENAKSQIETYMLKY